MSHSEESRQNNFGAIRLFLATRVLWFHVFLVSNGVEASIPVLNDLVSKGGIRNLSVHCFFMISGYLVTASWERSRGAADFMRKRFFRIVPPYLLAYVFSLVVAVVLGGASFHAEDFRRAVLHVLVLDQPVLFDAYRGLDITAPNTPMWTIAYEFRCYLLILLLGVAGLLERRFVMALFVVASTLTVLMPEDGPFRLTWLLWGAPSTTLRTLTFYLAGALFYLYRDRIVYEARFAALLAAMAVLVAWLDPALAVPVTAVFGGYVLFWMALGFKSPRLARVGRKVDLSFGMYLFAWPIQNALAWNFPELTPLPLFLGVFSGTILLALASWYWVEKPSMALARRPGRVPRTVGPVTADPQPQAPEAKAVV